ncbi:substrate-binding domain-containing protein [Paraburkholderia bannensis]|uniref:substrate-binding domain-containing protein n=1 Tax=Paraburkholderia bannensis TaxID=765414 RepID=UPI002AC3169D|nr:substrate-binding domain-containing protein [Paraburkholderia bannensis]
MKPNRIAFALSFVAMVAGSLAHAADKRIVLLTGIAGDPMYVTMGCGAQDVAKKHGYTFDSQGPLKWDAALQRPILDSIIASKPAGIIVVPTDDTALTRALKQAQSQGIKIALADTRTKDLSVAVSFVTADDDAVGKSAFEAMKKLAPEGGEVMSIAGEPGVSTSDGRVAAFRAAVAADPKFKDIGVQYGQSDTTRAANVISSTLQRHPHLVGIFSVDSDDADGAAAAIRQANLTGKVQIVTVDAVPGQITAVREGNQQALIAQKPYEEGAAAAEQLIASIEGRTPKAKVLTDTTIITKANIDTPEGKAAAYRTECSK